MCHLFRLIKGEIIVEDVYVPEILGNSRSVLIEIEIFRGIIASTIREMPWYSFTDSNNSIFIPFNFRRNQGCKVLQEYPSQ